MGVKPKRAKSKVSGRGKQPAKKAAAGKSAVKKAAVKNGRGPSTQERQWFTLYGFATSGPTYTAALDLSLMRHPFSYIHINLREGAHKQPDYLVKNRYGQVPALRDGQMVSVQSAAILLHLSEALDKFGSKVPLERQRIREWLFWQWDKLA